MKQRTRGHRVRTTETEQGVTHKRTQEIPENAVMNDYHMAIENEVPNSSDTDTIKKERMMDKRE